MNDEILKEAGVSLIDPTEGRSVFKYLSVSSGAKSILDQTIRYSRPQDLNDPFECLPRYDRAEVVSLVEEQTNDPKQRDKCVESIMNRDFVDFFKRMNDFGVTSFSTSSTTILMWSHYAEQHKGLCIEYDSSKIGSLAKVQYASTPERILCSVKNVSKQAVVSAMMTKGGEWAYEKEVRRFEVISNCVKNYDPALKRFVFTKKLPSDAIRGIYFGLYFDPVLMDDLCKYEYEINPKCCFYQEKRDTQKFAVGFDEYKIGSYAWTR